jgi:vacuolar-type H+-ATPase subunit F/Vma7
MPDRVAIIGEPDLVYAFKALGFLVFTPQDLEEARQILLRLEDEGVALCFLHERFYESLQKEIEDLRKEVFPVVVGYSDYRGVEDYLGKMMRQLAIRATGSSALVKRKGSDETR